MDDIVTVAQAAKELNMTPLSLRQLMIQNRINIGYAYRREGSSKHKFFIYRHLLDAEKRRIYGA